MLAAVDRAPAGRGSCAIRCAQDCSGDSWRQFGHDHLCHASRIRADAWSGIAAGLSSFRGLEQKEYVWTVRCSTGGAVRTLSRSTVTTFS
jgi:hypothetical protein